MSKGTSTSRSIATSPAPRPSDGSGRSLGENGKPSRIMGEGSSPSQKRGRMLLVADVIPNGIGQYIVTPRPPKGIQVGADGLTQWVPTVVARKILGLGAAMMWHIRQEALGKKHLRWRFISQSKRKILWDVESLFAYKAALQEIGK